MYLVTVMDGCDFDTIGAKRLFAHPVLAERWAEKECARRNADDPEYAGWHYTVEFIVVD